MKWMRWILNGFGIVLILLGSIWILQGVGVLPGSFMTGQIQWAYNGAFTALAGIGALALANWRRKKVPPAG